MVFLWALPSGRGGTLGMLHLMRAVREFDAFDKDNDPWDEHDFGSFSLHGETIFWKLDYYNVTMDGGSEDPADPSKTTRVMTIMLASEY